MVNRERYERAEVFLPENAESLVLNEEFDVHWIGENDRFWYRREQPTGTEFVRVDPEQDEQAPAFDHKQLADALAAETGESYDPEALPFDSFEYIEDESAVQFEAVGARYKCDLSTYDCEEITADEESDPGTSPDGRWVAYTDDHDLYVRDTANREVIQLTADGKEHYSYATPLLSPVEMVEEGTEDIDQPVEVTWSSDSKRLMTYRLDQRSANRFALVQSTPEDRLRPRHFTYAYPLPGEVGLPMVEPIVFDLEQRTRTDLDIDPIPVRYYGGEPLFEWNDDGDRLHYLHWPRGYDSVTFLEINPTTGESRTVIDEQSDTVVDPHVSGAHVVDGGAEVVWTSERSGYHHLYLVDGASGEITNQITDGEWVVRNVVRIDANAREIYFTASGREAGRDPYFRHLYRVNFDGSDLVLLTPEPADHEVEMSPSGEFVVDTYSRPDKPPVTVLRSAIDGCVRIELEEADVKQLLDTGWKYPEPFEAVAADGETDVYGLLWRPSDFESDENYPVIEQIYTGPHDFHVPKTFAAYRSTAQSIAELGFVVVMVDGRGTGRRSKAFRDYSYENLSRKGIEDHKAAIQQIAEKYSYLDLSRVGIYGHSAGGYDSTHALFEHPEFYHVAVSSGGNHDHRLDKASWNELWMGYPVDDHYSEQSNCTIADRLEGELLLVHGELDQNVHPASTRRLVDALIAANKDFDMLTIPNRHHDLSGDPYFVRTRWDYFVDHLQDGTSPEEYDIDSYR
ncbi:S9 family peptidase [Halocatena marina]|uniref:S9 family peptidase n=1 Tax=Halocatena marina TaxID=2934937 RepID=UPI00200E2144|nr:DPP IV N-terminal domain-containing protein [Halocatena marina]